MGIGPCLGLRSGTLEGLTTIAFSAGLVAAIMLLGAFWNPPASIAATLLCKVARRLAAVAGSRPRFCRTGLPCDSIVRCVFRPSGGIGRRTGLKILCTVRYVRVRSPPRPIADVDSWNTLQTPFPLSSPQPKRPFPQRLLTPDTSASTDGLATAGHVDPAVRELPLVGQGRDAHVGHEPRERLVTRSTTSQIPHYFCFPGFAPASVRL